MDMAMTDSLLGQNADVPAREDTDLVSVLFIADDPDLAEIYRAKLEVDGYRVTIVGADEATQKPGARGLPDIIYLDIRVPHRDRIDVLKTLRVNRSTKAIPVVILSDYRRQELIEVGASLGVDEYLVSSNTHTPLSTSIDQWSRRLEQFG